MRRDTGISEAITTDRTRLILRLACKGHDPHGVLRHWPRDLPEPSLTLVALLLSVHAERIAAMRQVWSKRT